MALIDVGRVCRITAGRGAGEFAVVVAGVKDNRCEVVTLDARKSVAAVAHLEPTPTVVELKKGASEEAAAKELAGAGLKTSI